MCSKQIDDLAEKLDVLAAELFLLKKKAPSEDVLNSIDSTSEELQKTAEFYNELIDKEPTHRAPAFGWACFHCGFRFYTQKAAREHFGETPEADPACQTKKPEQLS